MLGAVYLLWLRGQWPARSCIVHCDVNSGGKAGPLLFLFRVSGTEECVQLWCCTHTESWKVWKAQPQVFGLPGCSHSRNWLHRNNGSWDASPVSALFHMCSDIIGLLGPTTTCSFDQARRNAENLQALPKHFLWMSLGKPGSCLKWQSD